MMRLTPLSLAANTIFYLILAVMYCRVLTRRFSWPFTLLGLTVGYLLYIIPTKFMPYADAERMLFGLVTFPLTPIVLFRDKWYKSLLCAFAGLVAMAGSDLLSVSWLLTPEQLRQGLTFQPIPVQLAVYAIFLAADGLLMFLFTLLMNRYQNRLSGREWALYLAFPASQYLLIYGWVIFLRTDFILRRVLMLLLALAICTAADALLFTAIRGMAQRSELKARNDLLARQIDRQNEHYAALTAQYENLRRIRHDISSHLYTMQLLLQEGRMTRAAAYSAEVTEACRFRSDLGACENPVVRRLSLLPHGGAARAGLYPAAAGLHPRGDGHPQRRHGRRLRKPPRQRRRGLPRRRREASFSLGPHGPRLPVYRGPQPGPGRAHTAQPPHPGAGARHRLAHPPRAGGDL